MYSADTPVLPPGKLVEQTLAWLTSFTGSSAAAASHGLHIGSKRICLRFFSHCAERLILPALSHLLTEESGGSDLQVNIVDSSLTNPPEEVLSSHVSVNYAHAVEESFPVFFYQTREIKVAFCVDRTISEISIFDASARQAIVWCELRSAARRIPIERICSPLRILLSWFFQSEDICLLHAGAVGSSSGGIIFAGKSRAGKTTCALSAAQAGLGYAGDDSVLVSTSGLPIVYSVYNTARLVREDLCRFPFVQSGLTGDTANEDDKHQIFFYPKLKNMLCHQFPLRAIVIPVVADGRSQLKKAGPITALKALAPSTLLHA
ncbi:MAG TPA: hypothetical protein PLP17_04445, partial [Oligoflexia bacterium]|nr:hypothetical protein [Oligoflexia bacterium]